jgi:acetoin utilization protein AcuB
MMNEPIKSIMTADPLCLSSDDKLSRVHELFMKHRIHHLPVTEGDKLVGLVTTYDLWKINKNFDQYTEISVREIMSKKVAKISPEDKVGTAAEIFLDNRFHALPVVDENDKLVGIVTSFDILRYEFRKEYKSPILYKEIYEKGMTVQ